MNLRRILGNAAFFAWVTPSTGLAGEAGGEPEPVGEVLVVPDALHRIATVFWQPGWIDLPDVGRSAFEALESVDERILVDVDDARVRVRVGPHETTWNLGALTDLEGLAAALEGASAWLAPLLPPTTEAIERPVRLELQRAAIAGALRPLDRWGRVIPVTQNGTFDARYGGTLAGIGSRVGRREGVLRILRPFPDSPAERAGLLPGDVILAIDGLSTTNLSTDDAVDRIRGAAGTEVVLRLRAVDGTERQVAITRAEVRVPSVESRALTDRVGLVIVDHFSSRTPDEVQEQLTSLTTAGADRFVLDLRGNSGGSLKGAARVANAFVAEGALVTTVGRGGEPVRGLTHRLMARARQRVTTAPVVVLVDGGTASGSEIVAGILAQTGRAVIVGSQTFGKGTVQQVFDLPSDDRLKLTVARYLVGGDYGAWIHEVGVTPHVEVGTFLLGRATPDGAAPGERTGERIPDRGPRRGEPRLYEDGTPTVTGWNAEPHARLLRAVVCGSWTGAAPDAPTTWWAGFGPTPACAGADDGDDRFHDLELRLAVDALEQLPDGADTRALLDRVVARAAELDAASERRLGEAARSAGIAWSDGPVRWLSPDPADRPADRDADLEPIADGVQLTVTTTPLVAGGTAQVTVRVDHAGATPVTHGRVRLHSGNDDLDDIELLIGDVAPGASAERVRAIVVSPSFDTGRRDLEAVLYDDRGKVARWTGTVDRVRPPVPTLAVRTEVHPEADGTWRVHAQIRNDGPGAAGEVATWLGNPVDRRIALIDREAALGALAPGEVAEATLRVRVIGDDGAPKLVLFAVDREQRVRSSVPITLVESSDPTWHSPPVVDLEGSNAPIMAKKVAKLRVFASDPEGIASITAYASGDRIARWEATGPTPAWEVKLRVPVDPGANAIAVDVQDTTGLVTRRRVYVWDPRPPEADRSPPRPEGPG